MDPLFALYVALWAAACLAAVALVARRPSAYALVQRPYRRYLARPWKLATFVLGTAGLTALAPLSGDPYWDYADSLFMSVLTFATAPWSVGVLYGALRGREGAAPAFVAACAWLFSASWSYDLYLLLRDGVYPFTWWSNLLASSGLYLLAGLFWNLEWHEGRGATLGFLHRGWPDPARARHFRPLLGHALAIAAAVGAILLPFFWDGAA